MWNCTWSLQWFKLTLLFWEIETNQLGTYQLIFTEIVLIRFSLKNKMKFYKYIFKLASRYIGLLYIQYIHVWIKSILNKYNVISIN